MKNYKFLTNVILNKKSCPLKVDEKAICAKQCYIPVKGNAQNLSKLAKKIPDKVTGSHDSL